jgi:D-alanine-D-alanine ligase-like ATP-grasp enzyme
MASDGSHSTSATELVDRAPGSLRRDAAWRGKLVDFLAETKRCCSQEVMVAKHIGILQVTTERAVAPAAASNPPAFAYSNRAFSEHSHALAQALQDLGYAVSVIRCTADDLPARLDPRPDYLWPVVDPHLAADGIVAHLRSLQVPVIGPSLTALHGLSNKNQARGLLSRAGVPVPVSMTLDCSRHEVASRLRGGNGLRHLVGWPAFLKPSRGRNGEGVFRIDDEAALDALHGTVTASGGPADREEWLLERAIDGREFQAIVLAGEILGWSERIDHKQPEFGREWISPPELRSTQISGLNHLARRAALTCGLERWLCRVDILHSDRHNEVVLEVEPWISLERDELCARLGRAHGYPIKNVVAGLLNQAGVTNAKSSWAHETRPTLA